DDRARAFQALYDCRVKRGNEVFEDSRRRGRGHSTHVDVVFDREGYPDQWSEVVAGDAPPVNLLRARERAVGIHERERVERPVNGGNAIECSATGLDGGYAPRRDVLP